MRDVKQSTHETVFVDGSIVQREFSERVNPAYALAESALVVSALGSILSAFLFPLWRGVFGVGIGFSFLLMSAVPRKVRGSLIRETTLDIPRVPPDELIASFGSQLPRS